MPVTRHIQQMVYGEKFIMPDGGLIFDYGITLSLLDSVEKYNLPFTNIVIEYFMPFKEKQMREIAPEISTKRIILARDLGDKIAMSSVWYVDRVHIWEFGAWLAFDKTDPNKGWYPVVDAWNDYLMKHKTVEEVVYDISIEGCVLLQLLGALSCKNISVGSSKKDDKKNKKNAIPFDSYRRLVIGKSISHNMNAANVQEEKRHPREHLRRGHIRRLIGGNIWVNSTIVNLGVGGKLNKTYELSA